MLQLLPQLLFKVSPVFSEVLLTSVEHTLRRDVSADEKARRASI